MSFLPWCGTGGAEVNPLTNLKHPTKIDRIDAALRALGLILAQREMRRQSSRRERARLAQDESLGRRRKPARRPAGPAREADGGTIAWLRAAAWIWFA